MILFYLTTAIHYIKSRRPSPSVGGLMIWFNDTRGRMWSKFPDICLTVEEKFGKKLNLEIDPTGYRTRTRLVRGNDITPRPRVRKSRYWGETLQFPHPLQWRNEALLLLLWRTMYFPLALWTLVCVHRVLSAHRPVLLCAQNTPYCRRGL